MDFDVPPSSIKSAPYIGADDKAKTTTSKQSSWSRSSASSSGGLVSLKLAFKRLASEKIQVVWKNERNLMSALRIAKAKTPNNLLGYKLEQFSHEALALNSDCGYKRQNYFEDREEHNVLKLVENKDNQYSFYKGAGNEAARMILDNGFWKEMVCSDQLEQWPIPPLLADRTAFACYVDHFIRPFTAYFKFDSSMFCGTIYLAISKRDRCSF